MELIECITCGSHNFTNSKCDYCGNQYEYNDNKEVYVKTWCDNGISDYEPLVFPEMDEISDADLFVKSETGEKITKAMLIILVSIIWFAVTVFIPPLFIITIILLIVYGTYYLTIRRK